MLYIHNTAITQGYYDAFSYRAAFSLHQTKTGFPFYTCYFLRPKCNQIWWEIK